ncbi:Fc.00g083390.m01.CDS01 [Cosmosporella sp. VM-42]
MPSSDGLQPILTPTEREICRSYGGWTNFMLSYGLKPWNADDNPEGKAIIAGLAAEHDDETSGRSENRTDEGGKSQSGQGKATEK